MPATISVDDLAQRIPDGASLALAPDYSGCALAVVRALIRRRAQGLRLIGVPQLGFQADLLIGAGCALSVESAAVTLGEQGAAPRFVAALGAGAIEMRDSTCPVSTPACRRPRRACRSCRCAASWARTSCATGPTGG